jgi:hypothetical protein
VANKTFRIKHCATNSKHNICYRKAHHEREPEAAISAGHVLATVLALDVLNAKVPDAVIEILATKMSDPRSGCDSKASIPNGEGRNIEGQATPVIDDNITRNCAFHIQPICDRCHSWLFDDMQFVQDANLTSIFDACR